MIDGRANPSFAETEAASSAAILSASVAADGDSLEEEQPIEARAARKGNEKNGPPPLPCPVSCEKEKVPHRKRKKCGRDRRATPRR